MASPCTNLQSLQLEHTTITSATDNTSGVFVVPGSNPPQAWPAGVLPGHGNADADLGFVDQDRDLAA